MQQYPAFAFWKRCQMGTHSREVGTYLFAVSRSKEVGDISGKYVWCRVLDVDFLRFLSLITPLEENLSDFGSRCRRVATGWQIGAMPRDTCRVYLWGKRKDSSKLCFLCLFKCFLFFFCPDINLAVSPSSIYSPAYTLYLFSSSCGL